MIILYHVFSVIVRAATNMLAVPVWAAIGAGLLALFTEASFADTIWTTFTDVLGWSFTTVPGVIVTVVFLALGIVHGVRMAIAKSLVSPFGFLALILDNSWGLPNAVLGSIWATITLYIPIDTAKSEGSGRLVLTSGVFPGYDTTFGNVIAGNNVVTHETVHVIQAWVCGPFFYPIFIVNYVVNTVLPLWLILKKVFNIYPGKDIDSFGRYFTRGVYPFTLFELMAYAVEGSPN